MPQILDGKIISNRILVQLKTKIDHEISQGRRVPGLATILVGNDAASHVYVRNKRKRADELCIRNFHYDLDRNISQVGLLALINELNHNSNIDGILVQLPLPPHIDSFAILCAVDPSKDVDGFHPENIGKLSLGKPTFIPCTPKGCMYLIEESGVKLLGSHAVIVGRSAIVGKPMAYMMLSTDATVTICHRGTRDLKHHTQDADILIVAAGVAGLITPDYVKEGAVVIDVGVNKLEDGSIVGDVDASVMNKAKAMTPVPGGVGPMTISMLLENTVLAWNQKFLR